MSKPKILAVYAPGGVDFWRTWQPCKFMQKEGYADVRLLDVRVMSAKELSEGLKWCDIVSLRGAVSPEHLISMRQYQQLGRKVVVDHDDLFFNVSPFNKAYRQFGTEEVQVKDPTTGDVKDLWKDGVEGFDLKRNQSWFHSYVDCLREADLVTCTTVYLKDAIKEVSQREGPIAVIPNAIDLEQWKPLDIRDKLPNNFRFGWAVSNSHAEDWLHIKCGLQVFLKQHKDAKFVCLGDTGVQILGALPPEQVEWYPFSDLWEYHYPLRMAMLGLDVAIAPLADTEFNRCKSPLKYAEYTAFGWPVIAQNMTPYKEHIINGETGLLASDTASWFHALNALYNDVNLRKRLAFNARHTLNEFFDLKKVARDWANAYSEVIGKVNII